MSASHFNRQRQQVLAKRPPRAELQLAGSNTVELARVVVVRRTPVASKGLDPRTSCEVSFGSGCGRRMIN